jgi:hypothetical protein
MVTTFPSPYIFQQDTALEIKRCLAPGGKLVALLAARPLGLDLASSLIRGLFRVTGETPDPKKDFTRLLAPYTQAGFQVELAWATIEDADLLILGCVKIVEC